MEFEGVFGLEAGLGEDAEGFQDGELRKSQRKKGERKGASTDPEALSSAPGLLPVAVLPTESRCAPITILSALVPGIRAMMDFCVNAECVYCVTLIFVPATTVFTVLNNHVDACAPVVDL